MTFGFWQSGYLNSDGDARRIFVWWCHCAAVARGCGSKGEQNKTEPRSEAKTQQVELKLGVPFSTTLPHELRLKLAAGRKGIVSSIVFGFHCVVTCVGFLGESKGFGYSLGVYWELDGRKRKMVVMLGEVGRNRFVWGALLNLKPETE